MINILIEVILFWIIGTILSLYIHEFGHLIIGFFYHWKLFYFVVGPLKFYRSNMEGPIKIGFEPNILHWFGVGATVPRKKDLDNLNIWAKVLLAGPIFSLVGGLVCLGCALVFMSLFFLMVGLVSLAIGMINVVPSKLRTGLFYNDGTRYRRIKGGGSSAKEEAAIMNIIEKAVIYGDDAVYEKEECAPLTSSSDPIYQYYGYYILYNSALNNDCDAAKYYHNQMEQLSETVPKAVVNMFSMDDKE